MWEAVALGFIQGPAELLPVSSSAHLGAVPRLLGWRASELAPELRKAFEVALHAGAAAGLVIDDRERFGRLVARPWPGALAWMPAAAAGYLFQRPIERRLGGPAMTASGLVAGAALLVVADRRRGRRRRARRERMAEAADMLWLGLAQAAALAPGVSRSGATLAIARLRGFRPADAARLSRSAGLPVLVGAAALQAVRLRGGGLPRELCAPFAAGALASMASTLGSLRLIGSGAGQGSLLPYAAYRLALAGLIVSHSIRQDSRAGRPEPARA